MRADTSTTDNDAAADSFRRAMGELLGGSRKTCKRGNRKPCKHCSTLRPYSPYTYDNIRSVATRLRDVLGDVSSTSVLSKASTMVLLREACDMADIVLRALRDSEGLLSKVEFRIFR